MYKIKIDLPSSGEKVFTQIGDGKEKNRLMSVSEISRALTTDKTFENSTADVTFTNLNNYFDKLLLSDDGYMLGRTLSILNDDKLIFTGKISDFPSSSPEQFRLKADVQKAGLDKPVNKVLQKTDFPGLPEENQGKYGNIVAGTVSSDGSESKGALTAYRISENVFLAAWHHIKELTKVYNKEGEDITASCNLSESSGEKKFAFIEYTSEDSEIYFDCKGMVGYEGEVKTLLTNPVDILEKVNEIRTSVGELPFVFSGSTEARSIYDKRGYSGISLAITDGQTWMDFFKTFALNFDCLTFQRVDGSIGIKVLEWGGEEPAHTINSIYVDNETFEQWMDVSGIVNEYRRRYFYDYRENKFLKTPQDVEAGTEWGKGVSDIDLMYHTDDASCLDVVVRSLFFKKKPLIWYRFRIHKSKGDSIELADVIKTKFWNSYYDGQWRLVQIYRKSYSHDTDMITFEGLDITGVNKGTFILYEDSDPNIVLLNDESDELCEVLL